MRRKRDALRASQKGILNKHRNPNSLKEFCVFYFPKKSAQQRCGFPYAEKEGFTACVPERNPEQA
jgi:hypothetical protein